MHLLDKFRYCPACGSTGFVINNQTSKKCEDCGFTYYFNPRAACVAIILNDKNEILISLRKNEPAKGTWDFPGGFCETEETAEESVAREVKEETTLDVESVKYLFSVPNIYPYSGMNIHTMDLFFLCKVSVYDVTAHDDVEELKWVSIDSLKPEMFGLKSISEAVPRIKEILRR